MKICAKCKFEYSDEMAFCSRCGAPLQPKTQNNVCLACGKEIHAKNLTTCPYCGHKLDAPVTNKPAINTTTSPLQSKTQNNVCPACGKEIHAKNLRQCPYCGQKLVFSDSEKPGVDYTYKADILEKNAKPATAPLHPIPNANKENLAENTSSLNKNENESSEKESSSKNGLTTFILWCVGSLVLNALIHSLFLSNICLGLIPIVAIGTATGYYQKKRILPLVVIVVLSIVTICGLLIMKSISKEAIRNSLIPAKSGSVTQTMQSSNKETASDVIGKFYKPDLKTLKPVQNKIFANELEAESEILPGPERSAIDATKLLSPTVNYPRIYCFDAFDTYLGKDQNYVITIRYCLIDTITYPQKDLMDYWEVQTGNRYINNKLKEYTYPNVLHKQFNKQTNEERVIEKRMLAYKKGTGEPFFITSKDFHALSLSAEDMAFKKRKTPWQEIKNERMRKFYEFF